MAEVAGSNPAALILVKIGDTRAKRTAVEHVQVAPFAGIQALLYLLRPV
jgi:hypothetical protein